MPAPAIALGLAKMAPKILSSLKYANSAYQALDGRGRDGEQDRERERERDRGWFFNRDRGDRDDRDRDGRDRDRDYDRGNQINRGDLDDRGGLSLNINIHVPGLGKMSMLDGDGDRGGFTNLAALREGVAQNLIERRLQELPLQEAPVPQ